MKHSITEPRSGTQQELVPPRVVVEAAHALLGSIDLDPYSTADANRLVTAKRFLDRNQLSIPEITATPWDSHANCRVFLGIPSGATNTKHLLDKALREYKRGRVQQVVAWIGANEALIRTPWIWDFPVCMPFRRLRPGYWDDELSEFRPVAPSQWSAVLFLPPAEPTDLYFKAMSRFHVTFSPLGRIIFNEYAGEREWEIAYKNAFHSTPYQFHA